MAFENPADARTEQVKIYLNDYYKQKAKNLAAKRKKQLATLLFELIAEVLEEEEMLDEQTAA